MRARSSGPEIGVRSAPAAAPTATPNMNVSKPFIMLLLYFFDFVCNLVSKTFEFFFLDAGNVAADEAFDGFTGFATLLGCKKEGGGCAYQCAAYCG